MRTLSLTAALVLAAGLALLPSMAQPRPAYLDPAQPVPTRVNDLLGRMTLAEKVGQMTQIDAARLMGSTEWDRGPLNEEWLERALKRVGVGSVLSGGGVAPVPNTPGAWAEFTNAIQRYALTRSRLHIPVVYGSDAVHGHNNVAGATIFPHNIGLAASGDEPLVEAIAASTARTMRATGVHWTFAPVADLGRDPRWGRFYETYGEAPLLASRLVAGSVRGFQGSGLSGGVAATVKHFLGYGLARGGVDRGNALLPARDLGENVLPAYAAGLTAGAATVMANSGSVNGVPVHGSRALLTDLLRGKLGFRGVVVSDWEDLKKLQTVHRVADSFKAAVRLGIASGVDMYMVPHDVEGFASTLVELVNEGAVPLARVDEAVGRILSLKFELGLFEKPYADAAGANAAVLGADRALARRAAVESLTLLKNEGASLPIPASVQSVLVTGESADSVPNQMGGWTIGWQGVPAGSEVPPAVTVLTGLRAALPKGARLTSLPAADLEAVKKAARSAQYTVVVLGEKPYAEGEGDSRTPALAPDQERLLAALAGTGTRVVTVLLAGRPLLVSPTGLSASRAFLMAYLPGTEGGNAVADVLLGKASPAGRLPFTWPRSAEQLSAADSPAARSAPLFPFGAGLSYTSFGYSQLKAPPTVLPGGVLEVSLAVTNTGKVAGREVVQLFAGRAAAPTRRLVAFGRVVLRPGETQTVRLTVPASGLAVVPAGATGDTGLPQMVVEPGSYTLEAGGQRADFSVR